MAFTQQTAINESWSYFDRATLERAYKKALTNTVGKSYDSEIFFHESIIYFLVTKKIAERGIKVWTNYDCFYTDKPVDDIHLQYNYNVYRNKH